jgi:hypothetical protein
MIEGVLGRVLLLGMGGEGFWLCRWMVVVRVGGRVVVRGRGVRRVGVVMICFVDGSVASLLPCVKLRRGLGVEFWCEDLAGKERKMRDLCNFFWSNVLILKTGRKEGRKERRKTTSCLLRGPGFFAQAHRS